MTKLTEKRIFISSDWTEDPAHNISFLKAASVCLNNRLQAYGYLRENDVRHALGLPETVEDHVITKNRETIKWEDIGNIEVHVDERDKDLAALEYIYLPMDCYKPKKIIYNDPAIIVFWKDDTKTIVKISKDDHRKFIEYPVSNSSFDESEFIYYGFCCALAKKIFGTNSNLKRAIKEATVTDKEKK